MNCLKISHIRLLTVLKRSLKSSLIMLMFVPLNIENLKSEPNQANVSDESSARQKHYRVLAVGDVMLGSDWPNAIMDSRVTPGSQPSAVLGEKLASLFTDADIVFGNFEGTIHTSPIGAKACQNPNVCFTFRSPPFHAQYLAKVGFNMMSNANNHARDFGEVARTATYDNLTKSGITVSSADRDGMRFGIKSLPDGTRVVLVAFGHNPGLMPVTNLARVRELVKQAETLGDFTVVSCHIGAEGTSRQNVTRQNELFLGEARGNPWAFARAAIDAGGDVVLCHGPHVPRAVQIYKKRFIAYSLGNFWTYGRFNLTGAAGLAPIVDLKVNKNGEVHSAKIISARQDRPGGPYLDASNAAARTMAALTVADIPEDGLEISESGEIKWLAQGD
jgi:poly-gamma-glutamate capsule biosynthesis protein CapA/YwtB (metallophosphatase superfamily)